MIIPSKTFFAVNKKLTFDDTEYKGDVFPSHGNGKNGFQTILSAVSCYVEVGKIKASNSCFFPTFTELRKTVNLHQYK